MTVTPDEVQAEIDQFCIQMHLYTPPRLSFWLSEQMITFADLERRTYEKLLAAKLARELFGEQVQAFFAQNQSSFDEVQLYKIVVPYQSLAQELFYQIEEEEISFYEAAHLYDVDERRRLQCGYEGKQQRRLFKPEVAELLFTATLGEVIAPIQAAEDVYELYLVDEVFTATLTPKLYEDILDKFLQEWLNNEFALYLSQK
ncbi:MAG: peptidylprolyl isomerase [Synechococcales bacterium]|nr:peptidylprolyl isomerase [Synechococcales bacterium]